MAVILFQLMSQRPTLVSDLVGRTSDQEGIGLALMVGAVGSLLGRSLAGKLRIDTGGWAPFHNSAYISESIQGILVNNTSNERSHFSLSYG